MDAPFSMLFAYVFEGRIVFYSSNYEHFHTHTEQTILTNGGKGGEYVLDSVLL